MENILLLHGALGSKAVFTDLKQNLQAKYKVFTLDFPGHGGLAIPQEPYIMPLFEESIFAFLNEMGIQKTHIFGYSMGGYAALCFALKYPERVSSIFTLATKFAWSPAVAEHEIKKLNPAQIEEKVPHFAQELAKRHAPQNWKQVVHETASMMTNLGNTPLLTPETLRLVNIPVQLGLGDRDRMVTVEETLWAFKLLQNANLLVIPNARHPLEKVPTKRLVHEIEQFTNNLPKFKKEVIFS